MLTKRSADSFRNERVDRLYEIFFHRPFSVTYNGKAGEPC